MLSVSAKNLATNRMQIIFLLVYMETEAQLNSWIREGAVEKLAVIACDINGLKYVNDTKELKSMGAKTRE